MVSAKRVIIEAFKTANELSIVRLGLVIVSCCRREVPDFVEVLTCRFGR